MLCLQAGFSARLSACVWVYAVFSAGTVAPVLPVWKPLRLVFWVVISIFMILGLLHGILLLHKF